tara:strand:- start:273 stop:1250 length:978 start_codon:yes stop_codon:yes gene_type:complete
MSDENLEVVEPTDEVIEQDEDGSEEIDAAEEVVDDEAEVSADSPETQEELEEAIEDAIEEGASKEEIQDMIREFELKVNGKTFRKKIDLSDEDAIKRELQLAAAGRQSMQEVAELKKLYAQEIERIKSQPWDVLKELGLDPDELSEQRIQDRIEEMKKSPDQIEREKLQKELTEARKQLEEKEKRAEEVERARLLEQAEKDVENEILTALEAHQDLPSSPRVIKQIADTMLWAIDNGWDDVTVEEVLPTVKEEIRREISDLMDQLPEEMIEAYMGKKNMERLRQKRLKSIKKTPSKDVKTVTKHKESDEKVARKKVNLDDWLRNR